MPGSDRRHDALKLRYLIGAAALGVSDEAARELLRLAGGDAESADRSLEFFGRLSEWAGAEALNSAAMESLADNLGQFACAALAQCPEDAHGRSYGTDILLSGIRMGFVQGVRFGAAYVLQRSDGTEGRDDGEAD